MSLALVQEYFQQASLKKPIPTNKVFMTKIRTKGAPITWRYHIPLTLVLVCIFVLWFSLTKSQPGTVPILNLESLYGCCQPQLLRMFGFPSLKNCSHSMGTHYCKLESPRCYFGISGTRGQFHYQGNRWSYS